MSYSSFLRWVRAAVFVPLAFGAVPGLADQPVAGVTPDAAVLARQLPERLLAYIHRAPDRFVTSTADVIASYGGANGLGPDGIERLIASDRARLRARAVERILRADLDNDGSVSRPEMDNLIAISAEGARGRAETDWRAADADQNGTASPAEIKRFAEARALSGMSDEDATGYRAYMMMDANGDGLLTLDEVTAAVDALGRIKTEAVKKAL
jgi:hypothetical protein